MRKELSIKIGDTELVPHQTGVNELLFKNGYKVIFRPTEENHDDDYVIFYGILQSKHDYGHDYEYKSIDLYQDNIEGRHPEMQIHGYDIAAYTHIHCSNEVILEVLDPSGNLVGTFKGISAPDDRYRNIHTHDGLKKPWEGSIMHNNEVVATEMFWGEAYQIKEDIDYWSNSLYETVSIDLMDGGEY